jgi:hypothetical protein
MAMAQKGLFSDDDDGDGDDDDMLGRVCMGISSS